MTDRRIDRALREEPYSFEFFRAVRLLESQRPDSAPLGGFGDPADEAVRFAANTSIAFPASEIQALDLEQDGPARMVVNFMGLTGPQGVLPPHYTLLLAQRARERDTALRDFLDLFNHRLISLFYRAWEKHRFTVVYERGGEDPVMRHLRDLIGLGTEGLADRLDVPPEALVYYAGLLAMQSRPAVALEQLIGDYFGVPAEVEQFVGAWYPIDEATRCELGDHDSESARLGMGAVAGDAVWDQQARIRVRIGPLTRTHYDRLLPGGEDHDAICSVIRFFCRDECDFEIQLVLARDEVPPCVLGASDDAATPLGWCTWLRTTPFAHDPDDTVLVP